MTWTYSGNPGASDRDAVRFAIGDTDTNDQQLTNEEIAYLLTVAGSVVAASCSAIRKLIAKYVRLVDQTTGQISITYSQRASQYRALLSDIQDDGPVAAYAGGISISDKESVESDTDRDPPAFHRGLTDNPGSKYSLTGKD